MPNLAVQTTLSRQNSTIAEDAGVLRPGDEKAKEELTREAERAAIFQKMSNDTLDIPNGYRKVEVLILRWHESIDEFTGHSKEVRRLELGRCWVLTGIQQQIKDLKNIFRNGFGYGCAIQNIENDGPPQLALNIAIASHVQKHHEEDTLLIVYYTGHGNKLSRDNEGSQYLQLSA